jgi:glycerophosphoryl diester phosphodiesterase
MRTLVYAHRGSHLRGHRENTLPAFREAGAMGAGGIETDVRETADGRMALYHDDTVAGRPVETMTLRDLREAASLHVPTLEDVLERDWRHAWNIEVKTHAAWDLMQAYVEYLPDDVLVTSFIHSIPVAAARDHGIEAGILTASTPLHPLPAPSVAMRTCVVDARVLDADTAAGWHAAGWRLATYATNGEARHLRALWLGASIIITDEIETAMRLVDEFPS